MIGIFEIAKATCKTLNDNFPDIRIYAREVKEGMKTPSFFVNTKALVRNHNSKINKDIKALVNITYFSGNIPNAMENCKMQDRLLEAFGMLLETEDNKGDIKYLELKDISSGDTVNGDAYFNFRIDRIDYVNKEEEIKDKMADLFIEYDMDKGEIKWQK